MPKTKQPKGKKPKQPRSGQFPGAIAGNDASQPLPPGTERARAKNNTYYKEVEFLIWRTING